MSVTVLPQPLQHFFFFHEITWESKSQRERTDIRCEFWVTFRPVIRSFAEQYVSLEWRMSAKPMLNLCSTCAQRSGTQALSCQRYFASDLWTLCANLSLNFEKHCLIAFLSLILFGNNRYWLSESYIVSINLMENFSKTSLSRNQWLPLIREQRRWVRIAAQLQRRRPIIGSNVSDSEPNHIILGAIMSIMSIMSGIAGLRNQDWALVSVEPPTLESQPSPHNSYRDKWLEIFSGRARERALRWGRIGGRIACPWSWRTWCPGRPRRRLCAPIRAALRRSRSTLFHLHIESSKNKSSSVISKIEVFIANG